MKFGYFSHVWGGPGRTAAERYAELWDEVTLAEEAGFDLAFSVEHHFTPEESWMTTPAIFCTGAAVRTERIRVGAMGYIPALQDPLRVVEEIMALDHATNGRLDVGIVPGLKKSFFGPFRADHERRRELTDECVELLKVAGHADGAPFSFQGPVHSYDNVQLSFPPLQKPYPRLWIPTRDRNVLRQLAQVGAHTSATMILPRPALATVFKHYRRWWTQYGNPGQPDIGYWTLVHVADTDEEAVRRAGPHIVHTLTEILGYKSATSVAGGYAKPAALSTDDILRNAGDVQWLLDHNLIFVGSPETVANQIRSAADEGLFNTVLGEFNLGWQPFSEVAASIKLFGDEVIPRLRDYEPGQPQPVAAAPVPVAAAPAPVYSQSEEDQVAARLQALGYIE